VLLKLDFIIEAKIYFAKQHHITHLRESIVSRNKKAVMPGYKKTINCFLVIITCYLNVKAADFSVFFFFFQKFVEL